MRKIILTSLLFVLACSAAVWKSHADATVTGDYVEARTASVFAGACHYNGELVTTGNDAVLAWNIRHGEWKGTDLAGVRAIAVVSGDTNLSHNESARRSEIVIDGATSSTQLNAAVEALKSKYQTTLGEIASVRQAPIKFQHENKRFSVASANFAELSIEALPNDDCCKMPNLVWYAPFVQLETRKVGYTEKASFAGGIVGGAWQRSDENSAFYGRFTL
jgi:hypothetical protein